MIHKSQLRFVRNPFCAKFRRKNALVRMVLTANANLGIARMIKALVRLHQINKNKPKTRTFVKKVGTKNVRVSGALLM